jgi:hypothetical protein
LEGEGGGVRVGGVRGVVDERGAVGHVRHPAL